MSVYLFYIILAHTTAQGLTLCMSHTFCITYSILYTHTALTQSTVVAFIAVLTSAYIGR